jgi:hypothetical protein
MVGEHHQGTAEELLPLFGRKEAGNFFGGFEGLGQAVLAVGRVEVDDWYLLSGAGWQVS